MRAVVLRRGFGWVLALSATWLGCTSHRAVDNVRPIRCATGYACIWGRITEAAMGDPLPFVTVSVRNEITRTTRTDSTGQYFLDSIPPGAYEFRAEIMRHQPYVVPDIRFEAARSRELNIPLIPLTGN